MRYISDQKDIMISSLKAELFDVRQNYSEIDVNYDMLKTK